MWINDELAFEDIKSELLEAVRGGGSGGASRLFVFGLALSMGREDVVVEITGGCGVVLATGVALVLPVVVVVDVVVIFMIPFRSRARVF